MNDNKAVGKCWWCDKLMYEEDVSSEDKNFCHKCNDELKAMDNEEFKRQLEQKHWNINSIRKET